MSTIPVSAWLNLTGAFATIHAVGKQRNLLVNKIHVVNTSNADVTVELCAYPLTTPATTPSADNALLWDTVIAKNAYIEFGKGLIFGSEYTLCALTSSAGNVNVFISGEEA